MFTAQRKPFAIDSSLPRKERRTPVVIGPCLLRRSAALRDVCAVTPLTLVRCVTRAEEERSFFPHERSVDVLQTGHEVREDASENCTDVGISRSEDLRRDVRSFASGRDDTYAGSDNKNKERKSELSYIRLKKSRVFSVFSSMRSRVPCRCAEWNKGGG